ncbi:unnamed protein product, partial [Symbiodinium necroappetens]
AADDTPAARDPIRRYQTALYGDAGLLRFDALSQRQLRELKSVCNLSQIDIDTVRDIVQGGFRLERCLHVVLMPCLFACVLSTILEWLWSFWNPSDSLSYSILVLEFAKLFAWSCMFTVKQRATQRAAHQITKDLNQHFQGHARKLLFHTCARTRNLCRVELAWRFEVLACGGCP